MRQRGRPALSLWHCFILCASSAGCTSLDELHAEAAPVALERYLNELDEFDPSKYVEADASVAWNRLFHALETMPLNRTDFASRTIETHWVYQPYEALPGLNIQRRSRWVVHLVGSSVRDYRVSVEAIAEERSRKTCQGPTGWQSAPTSGDGKQAGLQAVLDSIARVPLDSFVFPVGEEELLGALIDVLVREWGLARHRGGLKFPLRSGWRTESYPTGEVSVEVRGSVLVRPVPKDAGLSVAVVTHVEHRGVDSEGATTPWEPSEEVAPMSSHLFAKLSEQIAPRVVIDEGPPLARVDPAPIPPDLPEPPDPLRGEYFLQIHAVSAPLTKPSGENWDAGALLAQVLPVLPGVVRLLSQLNLLPVGQVVSLLVQAAQHERADEFAERAGAWAGNQAAPDLGLLLQVGREQWQTPVGLNSHFAGWDGHVPLQLNGPDFVYWELWDFDFTQHDLVARGRVPLALLANACGAVVVEESGATLLLELTRQE